MWPFVIMPASPTLDHDPGLWQALEEFGIEAFTAQLLGEHMESHEDMTVVNRGNFGPVTLFRVYPEGVDTFQIKEAGMHDFVFRDISVATQFV